MTDTVRVLRGSRGSLRINLLTGEDGPACRLELVVDIIRDYNAILKRGGY